ncbi:hypothetical protein A9174_25000 [Mesorhizobium loti NZP2037]|nr:hypothetical protein [Mesorhizobium loti]ANN59653.1 hypothetical protein A9174_25000 [Mesorhizobium loti NZP2037]
MLIAGFNTQEHAHGSLYLSAKVALLQFRVDRQFQATDAAADEVQKALLEFVEAIHQPALPVAKA